MSLLNVETGELVEPLTRVDAERLTTRIRLRLDTIADNYAAVMPLIREAIERQAYAALGYTGVSQYVSECFGDALSQLGVEVRREVVRELTEAGMSTRAIAPVVGVSHMTVKADRDSGVKPFTPDPQAPESPAEGEAAADSGQTPQGEAAPEATPRATVPSETGPTTPSPRPAVTGLERRVCRPDQDGDARVPRRQPGRDSRRRGGRPCAGRARHPVRRLHDRARLPPVRSQVAGRRRRVLRQAPHGRRAGRGTPRPGPAQQARDRRFDAAPHRDGRGPRVVHPRMERLPRREVDSHPAPEGERPLPDGLVMHANPTAHPHLYDALFALTALAPRYWRRRP